MRRPSIAKMMLVIAFLAANFSLFRFLLAPGSGLVREVLAGFLPAFDALLVAAYYLFVKSRIRICRRPADERGRLAVPFLTIGFPLLLLSVFVILLIPDLVLAFLNYVGQPVERFLATFGIESRSDTPFNRLVIGPAYLGVMLSGPFLVITLSAAAVRSQFKLVIMPREEQPCVDSPSSA